MQGITVNEETLAFKAISAVGPGGNFLSNKHTRRHTRDLFLPKFIDRRPYNEWEDKKDNANDWALASAKEILATHNPDIIDPKISDELGNIIFTIENKI